MFRTILLPLDLGDEAEAKHLFSTASEMAGMLGATLHVMTVVPAFSMPMVASFFPEDFEKKAMAESEKELAAFVSANDTKGIVERQIVGHGSVYKEIVSTAKSTGCDAVLMGPGSKETGDFLLGHNTARVMRHGTCSVILIRKPA